MSSEKRPNIATLAIAAAIALCLFVYTSGRPAAESSPEPEVLASIEVAPIGGRIEITQGPSHLNQVTPPDSHSVRDQELEASGPAVQQPDPTDVAAARASEARAAQTLRTIAMAQEQFQAARSIDLNGDHVGEFGYLAELMGTVPLRSVSHQSTVDLSELNAFLPRDFAEVISTSAGGAFEVSGYIYALYLPATPRHNGEIEGLQEALHGGGGEALPDPYQSAHHWCAYAWPSSETLPARRAFFLDAGGLSLSTLNAAESPSRYIGAAHAPRWDAAYARADMSGQAGGRETCDGNVWDR